MTTYTLMSGQTVASNAPNGPAPAHVVLSGSPTRARVRLSVSGLASSMTTEATLWAQTAVTPYGYTQNVPLVVMQVPPSAAHSATESEQELPLNMDYYDFVYAELNVIDPSQQTAATMTLVA